MDNAHCFVSWDQFCTIWALFKAPRRWKSCSKCHWRRYWKQREDYDHFPEYSTNSMISHEAMGPLWWQNNNHGLQTTNLKNRSVVNLWYVAAKLSHPSIIKRVWYACLGVVLAWTRRKKKLNIGHKSEEFKPGAAQGYYGHAVGPARANPPRACLILSCSRAVNRLWTVKSCSNSNPAFDEVREHSKMKHKLEISSPRSVVKAAGGKDLGTWGE
jgi:hypothetical protein